MLRNLSCAHALSLAFFFATLPLSTAFAHCFVGARFFPATLAIDDPCVADELSLPTVDWFQTADVPPASEWDVSAEISKRITEDFGVSIGDTWSQIRQPGGFKMAGFGDLETTFQYQLLKNDDHELAMLLGLIVDWGGTGAVNSGIGTPLQPTHADLLFRQGVRRPARQRRLAARLRRYRAGRLSDPHRVLRSHAKYVHPAGADLRRIAAIQHAVPEIGDPRSSASRFHQSPDPDRRSATVDAGRQQFRQQLRHNRHRSIRA